MDIFSKIIFPVFGMIMIIFAIGTFFFSYGANIRDKIQKIELLGIKLEISIVTAVIVAGILFCGVGFYLNERNSQEKIKDAIAEAQKKQGQIDSIETKRQQLYETLEFYKTQSISYYFVLDDHDENTAPPQADKLLCIFYKNFREKTDSTIYKVKIGGANGYKVTFNNLSPDQFFEAAPVVYLVNKESKKRWVATSFNPLSPTLSLQPEE